MNMPSRIPVEEIAAMRTPALHGAWPTPQPLGVSIESLAYPVDALPTVVRDAVEEVQAFVQAPVPLVAASAISALSLAVQAIHDVQRAPTLSGPTSLYLLTIAESGERKSTCDNYFLGALREWQAEQEERLRPVREQYEKDYGAWEARVSGAKQRITQDEKAAKSTDAARRALEQVYADKPSRPSTPRLFYSDATSEALAFGLSTRWPSAGVMSSEGGAVFGSHGMSKDAAMRTLSMLNELWDGRPLTFDRVSRESVKLDGVRLTVGLQVQEPTIREFVERGGSLARGSGFFARFLLSWPESRIGSRPFREIKPRQPGLTRFHARVKSILNDSLSTLDGGRLVPSCLPLSSEAYGLWQVFHDQVEESQADGGELRDVRDVASKIADNAARLSALFHVVQYGAGGEVGAESFDAAARVTSWHLNESRRFFGELALPPELLNAARLDRWLVGHCRRQGVGIISRREVQRLGPNPIRCKQALDGALTELQSAGRLRLLESGSRRDVVVNPALLEEGRV